MKLATIRRTLSIISLVFITGSILALAGTFYTADHFAVQTVTTQRFASAQGYTEQLTITIHNAGLFPVTINFDGRILSGQIEVVRNSTSWTIEPNSGGNYDFSFFIDHATEATYFNPLAPQPIFDFTISGMTAYGLVGVTLTGQRNINMTGG